MDDKQLKLIIAKLDGITKLLAYSIVSDRKNVTDQIDALTKAGLKAKDIAEILGRKENQVYVTQNALRKKKNKAPTDENRAEERTDG